MSAVPSGSAQVRKLAATDPERLAFSAADATLTYGELDRLADGLASTVAHRLGQAPGVLALRFLRARSVCLGSLAASRSGRVVALIDPTTPAAQQDAVLADLGPHLLLTDDGGDQDVDGVAAEGLGLPRVALERDPQEPAAIIHTSGSTGLPKGLLVTGRQREGNGEWVRTFGTFRERTRVGMLSAGTMGQASELPQMAFSAGSSVVAYDVLTSGLDGLADWLRNERVEAIGLVPTLIRYLLPLLDADAVLPDLRTVAVWGEAGTWEDVAGLQRHLPRDAVIHNAYGTTETGMIAALEVDQDTALGSGALPAGRPLPGVSVEILGADGTAVPPGEPGELVVASDRVSLGHWNRPELDGGVFSTTVDGVRRCRTGDRAVLDEEGVLHLLGRLDDVVKVSGHRVALGAVERELRALPGVTDAAAAGRVDAHDAVRIHAFVTAGPGATSPDTMRAALAKRLPGYALPDTVAVLPVLPRLANGKVDRSALPHEVSAGVGAGGTDDTALVAAVREVFAQVLSLPEVEHGDDFFDLGGDSIRAARLCRLLEERAGVPVSTAVLFEASTPARLAEALAAPTDDVLVAVRPEGELAPLFVVHDGAGDVLFAGRMAAHLPPEVPIYALQPPVLQGPRAAEATLLELVDRYVADVVRVCPEGPYRLFGVSMGGVIAFEMARSLARQGRRVDLLALGDSATPQVAADTWLHNLPPHWSQGPRAAVGHVRHHLAYRARQARRTREERQTIRHTARERDREWAAFNRGDGPPAPVIRSEANLRTYGRLLAEHPLAGQLDGDVLMFRALRADGPPDNGWTEHVGGQLLVVPLACDHTEIVEEPHVAELCARLTEALGARVP
ncbi:non-ribosomal peptide synthetase [Nocardioides litoris]|uniref:non-ribosomal peptide synthetase n=1 Tax=Nocardioides litoris TaxID=1926648 RepID=UPI001122CB3C|nr:non-ribosomal peptide synthetase [Nocardioides litoris]